MSQVWSLASMLHRSTPPLLIPHRQSDVLRLAASTGTLTSTSLMDHRVALDLLGAGYPVGCQESLGYQAH